MTIFLKYLNNALKNRVESNAHLEFQSPGESKYYYINHNRRQVIRYLKSLYFIDIVEL